MTMRLALAGMLATAIALQAQPAQRIDEDYTRLIKEYLQDPRIR